MSDTSDPFGFGKLMPGFDFLQNLVQSAGKAGGPAAGGGMKLPGLSSWIAPTLNVEDLEQRIGELKAVHFWLEQNGKALAATIQALEVQKMTLATLKGMNLAMGDVAKAFQIKGGGGKTAAPGSASADNESWPLNQHKDKASDNRYAKSFQSGADEPRRAEAAPARTASPAPAAKNTDDDRQTRRDTQQNPELSGAGSAAGAGVIDPMQWWGALTGQFQQIAASAMQDATTNNPALKASREIASNAMKTANRMAKSLSDNARRQSTGRAATSGKKAAARPAAKKTAGAAASNSSNARQATGKRGSADRS